MIRHRLIAALASAVALAGAGPAHAASLDAAGTTIVAFADTHRSPIASQIPLALSLLKQMYCAGAADRGPALSPDQALAVARALVAADSAGRGLAAFAHSSDGSTEAGSIAAAGGALGLGKPAAALAALLRAHQLSPADPVPLIDAAPLLNDAGKGRAALALLAKAAGMRLPRTDPYGIGWPATIAANRGQALIVTHQYAGAVAALDAALKAAPLLREAEQDLTVAYACSGKQAQAQKTYLLGVRRQTFARGDYSGISTIDPFGELDPTEVLDSSQGQTLTLPELKYPPTMKEGVAQVEAWRQLEQSLASQETTAYQQLTSDQDQLSNQLRTALPITAQRTREILGAVNLAAAEPNLAALQHQTSTLQAQFGQYQVQGYGQSGCLNGGLHGVWLSTVQQYATVMRQYAAGLYRAQTALAANLKNPLAYQVAMDTARTNVNHSWFLLLDAGNLLSGYDLICDQQDQPSNENPQTGQEQTPAGTPCPAGLIGPGVKLKLLGLSITVNCEQVSLEASVGEGWLNGFVNLSHSFTKGSNTVYVGAQAGQKISAGPFAGGVSGKGGVYVTFGDTGAIQDYGLRGSSSASLTIDGKTRSIEGPSGSISLVGAFAPLF